MGQLALGSSVACTLHDRTAGAATPGLRWTCSTDARLSWESIRAQTRSEGSHGFKLDQREPRSAPGQTLQRSTGSLPPRTEHS